MRIKVDGKTLLCHLVWVDPEEALNQGGGLQSAQYFICKGQLAAQALRYEWEEYCKEKEKE
jgi:hypothetical protein